jgi:hypothetical protein
MPSYVCQARLLVSDLRPPERNYRLYLRFSEGRRSETYQATWRKLSSSDRSQGSSQESNACWQISWLTGGNRKLLSSDLSHILRLTERHYRLLANLTAHWRKLSSPYRPQDSLEETTVSWQVLKLTAKNYRLLADLLAHWRNYLLLTCTWPPEELPNFWQIWRLTWRNYSLLTNLKAR